MWPFLCNGVALPNTMKSRCASLPNLLPFDGLFFLSKLLLFILIWFDLSRDTKLNTFESFERMPTNKIYKEKRPVNECDVWWMKNGYERWVMGWHNTAVIVCLRCYNGRWYFGCGLYGRIGTGTHFHRKPFVRHGRTIVGRLRQLFFVGETISRAFFDYLRTGMSTAETCPLFGTQLTFVIRFRRRCTCENFGEGNIRNWVLLRRNLVNVYLQEAMLWHIAYDLGWRLSSAAWNRKYFSHQFVLYSVAATCKSPPLDLKMPKSMFGESSQHNRIDAVAHLPHSAA